MRLVRGSIVLSLLLLLAPPRLCCSALLLPQLQSLLQVMAPFLPSIPVWVAVICVLLFGLWFCLRLWLGFWLGVRFLGTVRVLFLLLIMSGVWCVRRVFIRRLWLWGGVLGAVVRVWLRVAVILLLLLLVVRVPWAWSISLLHF